MTKTGRQSTRHHEMHTEEDAMKKRLPFTTFFRSARAAFIGKDLKKILIGVIRKEKVGSFMAVNI